MDEIRLSGGFRKMEDPLPNIRIDAPIAQSDNASSTLQIAMFHVKQERETMDLHLYKRLTYKYQDGWSSLDESVYIGTAKMLSRRMLKDNGIDGRMHLTRVIAPASLGNTNLSDAIRSTLSFSRCRHDFDCCGCASVSASVKKLSRRQYSVRLVTTYNV